MRPGVQFGLARAVLDESLGYFFTYQKSHLNVFKYFVAFFLIIFFTMEVHPVVWLCVVLFLFISTFGLNSCLIVLLLTLIFVAGLLSMLCFKFDSCDKISMKDLLNNPLEQISFTRLFPQVLETFYEPKKDAEIDNTITGNGLVDSHLRDIYYYIIRDYVSSWYGIISSDTQFTKGIRQIAYTFTRNVAERVKDVDWMSHIMGRLVEDGVSQLRLFRAVNGGARPSGRSRPQRRVSPAPAPSRAAVQHHRRNKSDTDVTGMRDMHKYVANSRFYVEKMNEPIMSFEQEFFQLECKMEKELVSRENICSDDSIETCFLEEVTQLVLYVALGLDEVGNGAFLAVMRAVSCLSLKSIFTYLADPDTLNTLLLRWSCREGLSSESFLTALRSTDNVEDLKSTLELVQDEIQTLVSRDSVGECDIAVKQQLSSLQYVVRLINSRCSAVAPVASSSTNAAQNNTHLPMGFLLDNHLALCYFLDYAQSVNMHPYIFCYLSIQAWRVAAVKYFSKQKSGTDRADTEDCSGSGVRQAAQGIYDQYLAQGARSRLDQLPTGPVRALLGCLTEPLSEQALRGFDQIEDCILMQLQAIDSGFRSSMQYSRLLAELDIDGLSTSDINTKCEDKAKSTGQLSFGSKTSLSSLSDGRLSDNSESGTDKAGTSTRFYLTSAPNSRSQSPGGRTPQSSSKELCSDDPEVPENQVAPQNTLDPLQQWFLGQETYHLEAVIVETGLVQERGKSFGVYAVEVKRRCPSTGRQTCWHVYRRYSDFHELHQAVKETFPELTKLEFPSKKTFHNKSRSVLERRMLALGMWLGVLAALGSPGGPPRYSALHAALLLPFLSPRTPRDRQQTQRVIDTMLVQPLRQGMRTLRGVPGQLVNTVDDFMEGLSKVINGSKSGFTQDIPTKLETASFPTGEIWYDPQELPLPVLLLLLEEVFELRRCNRWLRRQVASLLRQLLTTMFADVINRKVTESISSITSPATVVYGLDTLKQKYWPDGSFTAGVAWPERDASAKARARVAAKTALLSLCQDELKRIIGSETTNRGLITLFELFQNPIINKRLLFVLIEGLIIKLYPEHDISGTFHRLLIPASKAD